MAVERFNFQHYSTHRSRLFSPRLVLFISSILDKYLVHLLYSTSYSIEVIMLKRFRWSLESRDTTEFRKNHKVDNLNSTMFYHHLANNKIPQKKTIQKISNVSWAFTNSRSAAHNEETSKVRNAGVVVCKIIVTEMIVAKFGIVRGHTPVLRRSLDQSVVWTRDNGMCRDIAQTYCPPI